MFITGSPIEELPAFQFERSTKLDYLTRRLKEDRRDNVKSLVFCKFRTEMSILSQCLDRARVCYCRFDGDMSKSKRDCALFNFTNVADITVMIIQIQAGGVGLNLQVASKVYITAPEWNPVVELQAIARVHRLKQTIPVQCVRLVMAGTVEEIACMRTEADKLEVIAECLGDESGMSRKKLGLDHVDTSVYNTGNRHDTLLEMCRDDMS
jgi:SNF2 family DNA or RNA helicase